MSSSQTSLMMQRFMELYNRAAAKNHIVRETPFEPTKKYTDVELQKALIEYAERLFDKFIQHKEEIQDRETKDLADYLISLEESLVSTSKDDIECKPPLETSDLTFDQLAGLENVKDQLRANYIYPFMYKKLFQNLAKGVLLYSVGGTGKTALARAATNEISNALFYAPSAGELRGKYEGETEKNIDAVFTCAHKAVKGSDKFAIVFFDEFDNIASKRGDDPGMNRSVNTLLQAMDGIASKSNVVVLAATNHPWNLDESILRRFTTRIFVELPDKIAIEYIIRETLSLNYSLYTFDAYCPESQSFDDVPGESESDRSRRLARLDIVNEDGTFNKQASFLKLIERFGNPETVTVSEGGMFAKSVAFIDTITNEYISELVSIFSATKDGADIIEEFKTGKVVSETDPRLSSSVHIFGFSPSDISKIIEFAIKRSALRAVDGYGTVQIIGTKKYLVFGGISKNEYIRVDEDYEIKEIDDSNKAKVVSFDIRRTDIEDAIRKLSSTVENISYYRHLQFAHRA